MAYGCIVQCALCIALCIGHWRLDTGHWTLDTGKGHSALDIGERHEGLRDVTFGTMLFDCWLMVDGMVLYGTVLE